MLTTRFWVSFFIEPLRLFSIPIDWWNMWIISLFKICVSEYSTSSNSTTYYIGPMVGPSLHLHPMISIPGLLHYTLGHAYTAGYKLWIECFELWVGSNCGCGGAPMHLDHSVIIQVTSRRSAWGVACSSWLLC